MEMSFTLAVAQIFEHINHLLGFNCNTLHVQLWPIRSWSDHNRWRFNSLCLPAVVPQTLPPNLRLPPMPSTADQLFMWFCTTWDSVRGRFDFHVAKSGVWYNLTIMGEEWCNLSWGSRCRTRNIVLCWQRGTHEIIFAKICIKTRFFSCLQ